MNAIHWQRFATVDLLQTPHDRGPSVSCQGPCSALVEAPAWHETQTPINRKKLNGSNWQSNGEKLTFNGKTPAWADAQPRHASGSRKSSEASRTRPRQHHRNRQRCSLAPYPETNKRCSMVHIFFCCVFSLALILAFSYLCDSASVANPRGP